MRVEILVKRGTGRAAIAEVRANPTRERLASAMAVGVSEPMIAWARRIVRFGAPELVVAVEEGRLALYMGARLALLSVNDQRKLLNVFTPSADGVAGATLTSRCLAVPPTVSTERDA